MKSFKLEPEKAIKKYLELSNAILDQNKLRPMELEVFSKLCYIDYLYSNLDKDKRNIILFHRQTRDKIRKSVKNISEASYNNILFSLRKKKLISSTELLYRLPIKDNALEFSLKFEFKND